MPTYAFFSHPRFATLTAACPTHTPETVYGHLARLEAYLSHYAPDGTLTGIDDAYLEAASHWRGEPGAWVAALRASGLLVARDGRQYLRGWPEHAPDYVRARIRVANARAERAGKPLPYPHSSEQFRTVPNSSEQFRTVPNSSEQFRTVRIERSGEERRGVDTPPPTPPARPAPVAGSGDWEWGGAGEKDAVEIQTIQRLLDGRHVSSAEAGRLARDPAVRLAHVQLAIEEADRKRLGPGGLVKLVRDPAGPEAHAANRAERDNQAEARRRAAAEEQRASDEAHAAHLARIDRVRSVLAGMAEDERLAIVREAYSGLDHSMRRYAGGNGELPADPLARPYGPLTVALLDAIEPLTPTLVPA